MQSYKSPRVKECASLRTDNFLKTFLTFNATDSPQSGVGEIAFLSSDLSLGLICGGVCAITYVCTRIQPIVRSNGDGHQAERSESPSCGQQRLNPTVTPSHGGSYYSPHCPRFSPHAPKRISQSADVPGIFV